MDALFSFNNRRNVMRYLTSEEFPTMDLVGIELEVENVSKIDESLLVHWEGVRDGSLRNNGREYVLVAPHCGASLEDALSELRGILGSDDGISCGERTSLHVHVDIRDISIKAFFKMLCTYLLFEKTLYKLAGSGREGNNFCHPLSDVNHSLLCIGFANTEDAHYNDRSLRNYIRMSSKYCGVNIGAAYTFGSLEFRMHEGTLDVDRISDWVHVLLSLKRYAVETCEDPTENLVNDEDSRGIEYVCEKVFGEYSRLLLDADPSARDNFYEGFNEVQYCNNILSLENGQFPLEYGEDEGEEEVSSTGQNFLGELASDRYRGVSSDQFSEAINRISEHHHNERLRRGESPSNSEETATPHNASA